MLDVRRGDGPEGCFDYTFASLAATEAFVDRRTRARRRRSSARCAARSALLAEDPERATEVGERIFPPEQAALIAELVRRDLPYYDAEIRERAITGMNRFARERGLLDGDPSYEQIVAIDIDRS